MAVLSGHPNAFGVVAVYIAAWAISGPLFKFSDTWRLAINTSSSIVTLMMVFLIQTSQNRDAAAIQLKLDALVRATEQATDRAVAAEELTEAELAELKLKIRASVEVDQGAAPPLAR